MKKKLKSKERSDSGILSSFGSTDRSDPPLSTPSLLLIPRGTGTYGRVAVIWPRRRETAVPGVDTPVGATIGDGVSTKYGKREKLEG